MGIKRELYKYLRDNTGVNAQVAGRVFQQIGGQDTVYPYIVLTRISQPGHHHMEAASPIANPSWQLDCWGASSSETELVAEAVRDALDGFRGLMGGVSGVNVRTASLQGQRDDYIDAIDGQEVGSWRVSMDFVIWIFQSIPTLAT